MEVNPNTIMRSFSFLQERNIIANRRGVGYFVAESGMTKARQWKREEFIEKLMPNFFHQAVALGVEESEMVELYRDYRSNEK